VPRRLQQRQHSPQRRARRCLVKLAGDL
jgi:hypothetical protein